ncbi:MAG TPA: hypothetical protein PLL15_06155 [Syntrophales bacterium]|nr:hypothetical protein [Syntrophales bacterium]
MEQKQELPKVVVEAQAAGKTILVLTGDDGRTYYFLKPGGKDIERFIATAVKGRAALAARNLVLEMALSPNSAEVAKEFEETPGRMVALNNALQAAVGMNEEFNAKKL